MILGSTLLHVSTVNTYAKGQNMREKYIQRKNKKHNSRHIAISSLVLGDFVSMTTNISKVTPFSISPYGEKNMFNCETKNWK